MKILNSRISDLDQVIPLSTPISGLEWVYSLNDDSILHIAINDGNGKYTSKKCSIQTFRQKIYEAVNNTLRTGYWNTHLKEYTFHNEKYGELFTYLGNSKNVLPDINRDSKFIEHLNYDFELIKTYVDTLRTNTESSLNAIDDRLNSIDAMFSSKMVLTTTNKNNEKTNVSVNHQKTENDNHCQMKIDFGNKISNEWIIPCDGQLVAYGWLDSSDALNNKAIPTAFCALEANINSSWEVIGVQSVIPAKAITYVCFNVHVHKDLKIRIRTGFSVGNKSGQYSNEQDGFGTLSNSTPNGFKCQIFSKT